MSASPRDITYVKTVEPGVKRGIIRTVENLTGRLRLMHLAQHYERDRAMGYDFWELALKYMETQLHFPQEDLENIPAEGPLVCIANHPFGVLDGLIMGYLLSLRRGKDFKIFAHGVFQHTEDVGAYILPVMFDEDAETVRKNLSVRREALDYLNDGGAIGIFPSGQVATSLKPFGDAIDRQWGVYTGRLVMRSRATVVPIYFAGQNSRLFQLMARVNDLVRVGLLLRELAKSYKGGVDLVIGKPVEREEIEKREQNPKLLMEYLRRCTYSLATPPLDDLSYGWDFDKAYGKGRNT